MMRNILWILVWLIAIVVGCDSTNIGANAPSDGALLGDIVEQANDNRQEPSGSAQTAGVNGTLKISDFTVLDEEGLVLTGANRFSGIMVRLVDPEDDILAATAPDATGRFTLDYVGPLTSLRLEFRLTVRDDLNGDGRGNELLQQVVPVFLAAGYTASIDLSLRKGSVADFDARLLPSKGMTLVSQLGVLDNAGQKSQYYATLFATNLAVIDLDGDRFFELGEDLSGADLNHDGWIDESQLAPNTPDVTVSSTLVGTIVSVDKALQQMRVRQSSGVEILVTVPPFTAIEILDKRTGTFLGPIPLDAQLIQSTVVVEGHFTPAGMDATWVVVYR